MQVLSGKDLLPHLSKIRKDTPGFLLECSRRYGDLVGFAVGGVKVFFINHPDFIRRVLQDNHHNYSKDTIQYNTLATITGRGLLTSDGEEWLRHRRLEQPAFSRSRLAALDQVIAPALEAMLKRWEQQPEDAVLDIDREMMAVTLEIVGQSLFSIDLRTDAPRLTQAVLTALDHVIYRAQNPFAPPDWLPIPQNIAFRKALRQLDQAVYEIMENRRRSGEIRDDLLAMLMNARDEEGKGSALTDQQIRDEIITLLIAGHETVASALTWSWYLLAQHPSIWEQMRAEVAQLPDDRLPCYPDLERLPFTAAVFSEALRLYPPAWLITRKAIGEDELNGYKISPGSLMVISPYVVHRHPQYWEDAEAFLPQRFTNGRERAIPRFAYIPFGGGPRLCIGNNFAMIEGVLILAGVTQHYRLELATANPVLADPLVTLRPHHGLPMRLRRVVS
ncbi:MAG: cytochrome P450 [Chloroflexota bacterium]|nr:MAG: cytochrome P450 [Bellilinea sp.]